MTKAFFVGAVRVIIEAWLRAGSLPNAVLAQHEKIRLDINNIHELRPGSILIYACYPKFGVERSALAVLSGFKSAGAQIIVVATTKLSSEDLRSLSQVASVVIRMPNIGRDIGAYQQGVFYLDEHLGLEKVDRLVFLNDSIYFFEKMKYTEVVKNMLDQSSAYVGANENFNSHYHVGSYFFSITGWLAASQKFRKFWHSYRPYSTRIHSIAAGEVGLTKLIMSMGVVPRILYQLADVAGDVAKIVGDRAPDTDYLLSIPSRRHVLDDRERFSRLGVVHGSERIVSNYEGIIKTREVDILLEFLQNHNQVHNLALLFCRGGMPFIKKDVVYRGMFLVPDIVKYCSEMGLECQEEIIRTLRVRNTPATVIGFRQRLLSRLGMI